MSRLLPNPLPSRQTTPAWDGRPWNISPADRPQRAALDHAPADLPAGLTADQPSKLARASGKRPILLRPGPVATVATVLYVGMWPLAFALPTNSDGYPGAGVGLIGSATIVYMLVVTLVAVWVQVRATRQDMHSGGRLPGRPALGAGGHASRRLPGPRVTSVQGTLHAYRVDVVLTGEVQPASS